MTLTLYVAHIWFVNSVYDTYSPTVGYLLQVSAALIIGLVVRFTAGREDEAPRSDSRGPRTHRCAEKAPDPVEYRLRDPPLMLSGTRSTATRGDETETARPGAAQPARCPRRW
ncbi:hypothetical protein [Rhodococcus aetherivorans]|uniref:hypothetical protein n=1 Tax=Rhodococcus aetherivorans TaxID=191292 RepID=UPI0005CAE593|nr:hypothetical protein [Rhodococcus aetherivorans]